MASNMRAGRGTTRRATVERWTQSSVCRRYADGAQGLVHRARSARGRRAARGALRPTLLMLGPPGTAKSMLAKEICRRLGGRYFEWLLTKFTTPEEISAPVSLQRAGARPLRTRVAGQAARGRGRVPRRDLQSELGDPQHAPHHPQRAPLPQGSDVMQVPLQTLFAASNELPEEDELGALYDRFLLRFTVGYIEQDFRFARLLRMETTPRLAARSSAATISPRCAPWSSGCTCPTACWPT